MTMYHTSVLGTWGVRPKLRDLVGKKVSLTEKAEKATTTNAFDTVTVVIQPADLGWPTGNGKKLSNIQVCCLAQLCLAAS